MAVPLDMRFYRYVVESLAILLPGLDPVDIKSTQITSLIIEKDYDNDYHPIVRLGVTMDPHMYSTIVHNKLTVKFRMRLQKYVTDSNNQNLLKKDVFNELFCIFLDDNTPFLEKDLYDKTNKVTDTQKTADNIAGQEYIFYLFSEGHTVFTNKLINTVIDSGTMMDVVTYSIAARGFSNVLMTPFDNKEVYEDILLPPLPFFGTFEYLDNQYGFHKLGTLLFFDNNRIYVIDKNPKCTAWEIDEYKRTTFHIKKSTNPDNLSPGSYEDSESKSYFINVTPSDISFDNNSVSQDLLEGNSLVVVTPSTGTSKTISGDTVQRREGIKKFVVNKYGNEFKDQAEIIRRQENSRVVQITLGDFDIDSLTPNKEFVITFEDTVNNKLHGGGYRISYSAISLIRQGEEFIVTGTALFKKYNE